MYLQSNADSSESTKLVTIKESCAVVVVEPIPVEEKTSVDGASVEEDATPLYQSQVKTLALRFLNLSEKGERFCRRCRE